MARKVFISFLGTSNYVECKYEICGTVSEPVRFVQEALISHHCRNWTSDDRIFIFCTSLASSGSMGSKEKNWVDNGHPEATEDIEKIGLESRLRGLQLNVPYECVEIPEGFSEEEIWKIFDKVYGKLEQGDEIYFDVTHAFRSTPLFSVVLFDYAKFMKGTVLMKVQYGAFEKLGQAREVKERILSERGIAPVVDMTNVVRLQEYCQIASELKTFGRVRSVSEAIALGEDRSIQQDLVEDLKDSIDALDEYITTIALEKIKSGEFISTFKDNYNLLKRHNAIQGPIRDILDNLNKSIEKFKPEDDYANVEQAIYWAIDHSMFMQAFALAEEYIIYRVCDRHKKPRRLRLYDYKTLVGNVLGVSSEVYEKREWQGLSKEWPKLANKVAVDDLVAELRAPYDRVRKARNSLAHGKGTFTSDELSEMLDNIKKCIEIINR